MDWDKVKVWVDTHRKFLVAIVAAAGVAWGFAADGEFSQNDIIGTVLAFMGAVGVERVPNELKAVAVAKRAGQRAVRRLDDEGGSILVTVLAVIGALVVLGILLGTCGNGR